MPSNRIHAAVATLAVLLALSGGTAVAQTPTPPPPACQSAEYRQFDFWLGEWEVFLPSGKKAGDSRIESISAGCALLENWSGSGGFSGKSLNSYDRGDKRWHQSWVDSSGSRLELAGSYADKRMVLSSASGAACSGSPGRSTTTAACASSGNPPPTAAPPGRCSSTASTCAASSGRFRSGYGLPALDRAVVEGEEEVVRW